MTCQKRGFDTSSLKSIYERNLLQHTFSNLPHNLQCLWVIRPKSDDVEVDNYDQENDQNLANYQDERGCPAQVGFSYHFRTYQARKKCFVFIRNR